MSHNSFKFYGVGKIFNDSCLSTSIVVLSAIRKTIDQKTEFKSRVEKNRQSLVFTIKSSVTENGSD